MGAPERILTKVGRAVEVVAAAGHPHEGLFPSLLDRTSGAMLQHLPPPIPGQRTGDRAHLGSNLIHDQALLKTMYGLSAAVGRRAYADAADRYLQRFATHCTATATGLFPWGEHAFWHLTHDTVGNSALLHDPSRTGGAIHDHLRQAPVWLWEKLSHYDRTCVERFGEGLDYHWKAGQPAEYTRHAPIEARVHPAERAARSYDFPRHSGFYILDWAFAYGQTGRADFLQQIRRMLDYWWTKRDEQGLLLHESRSPAGATWYYQVNAPGQTLSLAASLLESAELLHEREPQLAAEMRQRAAVYLDGFLAAAHDPAQGVFLLLCGRGANDFLLPMPIWGSSYGLWPASYVALTVLCAYRLTHDPRLLAWAAAVGRQYGEHAFPQDALVPAMDAGLGLGLLADLYDVTGERRWLDAGLALARTLLATYLDGDLPRGAAGIGWYESQMGPGFLLHGLTRIALLSLDKEHCPLEADYTAR